MNLARLSQVSPQDLAPIIRPAGFYNLKSRRLHALVTWLAGRGGLGRLRKQDTVWLRTRLLGLPGIGPETADSILLYALGRPVFVIDAYTRRILFRYGIAGGNERYDELQAIFHSSLPPDPGLYNEYHALLVRLAKTHCRTQPACTGCPLA